MWQWRCAAAEAATENDSITEFPALPPPPPPPPAALHSTTVTNQRENAGTQFSPVPILHPIIQSVRPSPPPLTTSALTPPECLLSAPSQPSSSLPRPSPKSPLIYIIAKTEKKRRPCPSVRPAVARRELRKMKGKVHV